MRLATVIHKGSPQAALIDGDRVSLLAFPGLRDLLESGNSLGALTKKIEATLDIGEIQIAAPVREPEKTICVGLNFRDHAVEAGYALPEFPTLFAKYSRCLIGPFDEIEMPSVSDAVDWEAELGIIIGKACRNVKENKALDCIAGYTVVNDVSMRDWQLRTSQFLQGKTFERCTPVGPYMVTPDEIDHASNLAISCHVNGKQMQFSSTDQMIFSPAQIVAYISKIITLVPGDTIACGTPRGIGGLMKPPVYLRPGDIVATKIEGIGELINRCSEILSESG
jgi:acylpyruvate hydrolase